MNKSELIQHIADRADISKAAAGRALEATIGAVTRELQKGNDVAITGFGTFSLKERAARTGRSPATGKAIQIAAKNTAHFKPGKALKDALN